MENKNIFDRLIWLLMPFVFSVWAICEGMNWPSVTPLIPLSVIVVSYIFSNNKGNIIKNISYIHFYLLMFVVFCLCSSLWATNTDVALDRSLSLVKMYSVFFVIYLCCQQEKNIKNILYSIMWSNYLVMAITIFFYGFNIILMLLIYQTRVDNDFLNANTLGMGAAYSFIIGFYYLYYEKNIWNIFFMLPAFMMLAVSGSKKALIILVLGISLLVLFKQFSTKFSLKTFLKLFISVIFICCFLTVLMNLPFMEGIIGRFDLMMNIFSNESAGFSTEERYSLILLGIDLFKDNFILGVGIDNAKLYVPVYQHYLHSNPFELLADVGIIGFILYYWIYVFIGYRFIKYRNFNSNEYIICLVIFCINMLLQITYVSYESPITYLYLMLFYYESILLKNEKQRNEISVT